MAKHSITAVPKVLGAEKRTRLATAVPGKKSVGLENDLRTDFFVRPQGPFVLEQLNAKTFDAIYDSTKPLWTGGIFDLVQRNNGLVQATVNVCFQEAVVAMRCPPPAPVTPPDPPDGPFDPPPDPEEPPPVEEPDFPPVEEPDPPDPPPVVDPPAEPAEPVLNTVSEVTRESDEIITSVVTAPTNPPPSEPEIPSEPPPEPPPGSEEFHRTISGTFNEDLIIPDGQKWRFQNVTMVRAHIRTVGGEFHMRPGDRVKFMGGIPNEYRGGGMTYGPGMEKDFGIWIGDEGHIDIRGTPVLGWNRTGTHSTWSPNDEYWISPTNKGDFTPRRWFPGQPIPLVDATMERAEVMNVTRDVIIEGIGHIHIHAHSRPWRIEYCQINGFGVSNDSGNVLGRYVIHAHHNFEGSRGSVVRGVAAIHSNSKVYVPHFSNGITYTDCVSVESRGDAFWWDLGELANDILVDRCCFSGVHSVAFANVMTLGRGEGVLEVRDCAVSGGRGLDVNGFGWPEVPILFDSEPNGAWVFGQGNVAHNCEGMGIRFWLNTNKAHLVENAKLYHNRGSGIENGAYLNPIRYNNIRAYKNGAGGWFSSFIRPGVMFPANSDIDPLGNPQALMNSVIVADEGPAITIGSAALPPTTTMEVEDCSFTAGLGQPKVLLMPGGGDHHRQDVRFLRCGLVPSDVVFADPVLEGAKVVLEDEDGSGTIIEIVDGERTETPF